MMGPLACLKCGKAFSELSSLKLHADYICNVVTATHNHENQVWHHAIQPKVIEPKAMVENRIKMAVKIKSEKSNESCLDIQPESEVTNFIETVEPLSLEIKEEPLEERQKNLEPTDKATEMGPLGQRTEILSNKTNDMKATVKTEPNDDPIPSVDSRSLTKDDREPIGQQGEHDILADWPDRSFRCDKCCKSFICEDIFRSHQWNHLLNSVGPRATSTKSRSDRPKRKPTISSRPTPNDAPERPKKPDNVNNADIMSIDASQSNETPTTDELNLSKKLSEMKGTKPKSLLQEIKLEPERPTVLVEPQDVSEPKDTERLVPEKCNESSTPMLIPLKISVPRAPRLSYNDPIKRKVRERDLNNKASQRCRINRKLQYQAMLDELKDEEERNKYLKHKYKVLLDELNLAKKLLEMKGMKPKSLLQEMKVEPERPKVAVEPQVVSEPRDTERLVPEKCNKVDEVIQNFLQECDDVVGNKVERKLVRELPIVSSKPKRKEKQSLKRQAKSNVLPEGRITVPLEKKKAVTEKVLNHFKRYPLIRPGPPPEKKSWHNFIRK